MKIMFVATSYHPHIGGVEYVVKSVAERLVKRGHDVTVLCGEPSVDDPREEWVNGVRVVRWPVWAPGGAYHVPRLRGRLRSWLSKAARECDVVHFHSVHSILTVYSLNALKECRARQVVTPHYHGTGHTALRRLLWLAWRGYVERALASANVVHTVSEFESRLVLEDFKVESVTIEHGVEEWLSGVTWSPSGYAMYSGRIERYKNVHRLANVVKILNDMGLDLELKVFGSGPYADKLMKHLNRLKIRYEFKPPQPYKEYIMYLSRASLFGLLSQKEAYGLTVNEANVIGVPIVVVEPWGSNFSGRSRTLITRLDRSDGELAKEIGTFLGEAKKEPRSRVPSWNQVVDIYIKKLYCPQEN
jgi:glycosyltransferase involved in cell wall biosynthesis